MKRIFVLFVISAVTLCSCSFSLFNEAETTTTTEYVSPYATDINGQLVPKHEDVSESALDPMLFDFDENGRAIYKDTEQKIITGIDVSVFQGDIDWNAVAEDGIDFVMLRIGYRGYGEKGIMGIDDRFYQNYNGASAVGLDVGVYFYSQAINAQEAVEEAQFVLDSLGDLELAYPVAYDWEHVEDDAARTKDMTNEKITECAKAFCEEIEKAGRKAIIYFNCEIGYFEYDLKKVENYDFWLAEYENYPSFVYDYKMWQYTDKGSVAGINGDVDLNISTVDYSAIGDFG